jgi:hypothetical protein
MPQLRTISQKLFDKLPENFRKDIDDENEKKKNKKNAPKKDKTGYNIFVQEKHSEFKGKGAMSEIAKVWNLLDEAGKKVYNERAAALKVENAEHATTSSEAVVPKEKKTKKSKKTSESAEQAAAPSEPVAEQVAEPVAAASEEAQVKKVKKVKKVTETVAA